MCDFCTMKKCTKTQHKFVSFCQVQIVPFLLTNNYYFGIIKEDQKVIHKNYTKLKRRNKNENYNGKK